jgi:hypothetical protein
MTSRNGESVALAVRLGDPFALGFRLPPSVS